MLQLSARAQPLVALYPCVNYNVEANEICPCYFSLYLKKPVQAEKGENDQASECSGCMVFLHAQVLSKSCWSQMSSWSDGSNLSSCSELPNAGLRVSMRTSNNVDAMFLGDSVNKQKRMLSCNLRGPWGTDS